MESVEYETFLVRIEMLGRERESQDTEPMIQMAKLKNTISRVFHKKFDIWRSICSLSLPLKSQEGSS